jgi:signal transduction histidine kinase
MAGVPGTKAVSLEQSVVRWKTGPCWRLGSDPMFVQALKALILLFSLLSHFLSWLLFYTAAGESQVLAKFLVDFHILLVVSFSLCLCSNIVSKQWIVGILLILRTGVIILIGVPFGDDMGVKVILLLALVTESTFLLKSPQDLLFPILAVALFLIAQKTHYVFDFTRPGPTLVVRIVVTACAMIVLLFAATLKRLLMTMALTASENTQLADSNIRLAETNLKFQEAFLREKAELVKEERKRIAREVHDSIAYTLTNLIMMIEDAIDLHRNGDSRLPHHLQTTRAHAHEGLIEIRQAIKLLRERAVRGRGDIAEVFALASAFEKASHIKVDINVVSHGILRLRLTDRVSNTLFRLIQESMTNSVRHGRATQILVFFDYQGGNLRVNISDNGMGSQAITEGFGIQGMRERVAEVNGRIDFRESSQGFALTAWLPIVSGILDETDTHTAG